MTSCCQQSIFCCESSVKSDNGSSLSFTVALVGNPNCGKTTLFNALTGAKQRIGNWPGVTVERKSGLFTESGIEIEVVDLPGIYSIIQPTEIGAIDERIACGYVISQQADLIINIVDASHLERHLYLTMQLLEMGKPIIVALNMMDMLHKRNISIDIVKLAEKLGCPVIAIEAHQGNGVPILKNQIANIAINQPAFTPHPANIDATIQHAITSFATEEQIAPWIVMRLLEGDISVHELVSSQILEKILLLQAGLTNTLEEELDILLANARYCAIQRIIQQIFQDQHDPYPVTWTERIDNIVLNRVLGIPIFLSIMYFLFFFSINIGGSFQDFFDLSSQTIFVDGFAHLLNHWHTPTWLTVLLANGIGKGINTTITFIPVIGFMFLFLTLLEDSGYMARAAFVVDRFMRFLGLPGKAFVPMIVGFGCNVPAVMAARTLEHHRDRILTILMAPFMSCGARLAIFAVFTAAFFPHNGQNIIFSLYLIGIGMAMLTGFILRFTLLKGDSSPLMMELPQYHVPQIRSLVLHAWQRLNQFVVRAGRLIIPICVLIGALNSLNIDGTINTGEGDAQSLLSAIGRSVSPLFSPMGITPDNWPATVGLVTGILAKEVVVGTLNTLYTQVGLLSSLGNNDPFQFWNGISAAFYSIPHNLAKLSNALSNPILAKAPIDTVHQGVYGLMYKKFDGQIGAFAYLLFILLYFPCISTLGAMLREVHKGWSIFSTCWMTGIAYGTAVIFYQAATWSRHPLSSSLWIIGILFCFFGTIISIRWLAAEIHYCPPASPHKLANKEKLA